MKYNKSPYRCRLDSGRGTNDIRKCERAEITVSFNEVVQYGIYYQGWSGIKRIFD